MQNDYFFNTYLFSRRFYNNIAKAFKNIGQNYQMEHYLILMMLNHKKSARQSEIATTIMLDKTTTTRTIEKLVTMGLITRGTDREDRRINIIEITEKGESIFKILQPIYTEQRDFILDGISQEDRELYIKLFKKVFVKYFN